MAAHKFGGQWTIDKLEIFTKYLEFYSNALKNQPFNLIYIDAFAGTGKIDIENVQTEILGSASLALSAQNPFDKYYFIEKSKRKCKELQTIVDGFPSRKDSVEILCQDCNDAIERICAKTNWQQNRALLFLDPYSTQVKWETLQVIANTQAIDVWYLFPFGAANRLLKVDGTIDNAWKAKLNRIFGEDNWFEKFYVEDMQISLFDDNNSLIKDVDTEGLKNYIIHRLEAVFPRVSHNAKMLYNSKRSPFFLFCFAVSNHSHKAQGLALKVANEILKYDPQ